MKKFYVLVLALALVSGQAIADKGAIGFSASVSVSGFFSPELTEVKVDEVFEGSPAALAGLKAGYLITSIDGCNVPGCSASKAKKLMKKTPGETLNLRVKPDEKSDEISIAIHVQ
ncbi:PDZ domain-containing protein [Aestuariibacter sp. AA17]|uniref:PDZ domain-containing protein n=1 Tax=Fluctibacter corallii TaxID=2984329 RepID=A0ABT3A543_9ALTE|nr:PDZ domain-containing protein [Aestuariibacter sp. AA17]MCV2883818.1 PDZ domain-containing protein [Aestuariibacter sp. AA17]